MCEQGGASATDAPEVSLAGMGLTAEGDGASVTGGASNSGGAGEAAHSEEERSDTGAWDDELTRVKDEMIHAMHESGSLGRSNTSASQGGTARARSIHAAPPGDTSDRTRGHLVNAQSVRTLRISVRHQLAAVQPARASSAA